MYHYKARMYSPFLGRFPQTDPVGYDDQFNLYAYVGNDPVNGTDPSGMAIVTGSHIPGKEGGIAIGLSGTSTFFGALGTEEGSDGPLEGRSRADQRSAAQINRFREDSRATYQHTQDGVTMTITRQGNRITGSFTKDGRALLFTGRFVDTPGRREIRVEGVTFRTRSVVGVVNSAPTSIRIANHSDGKIYVTTNRPLIITIGGIREVVNIPSGRRPLN